jgi:hypothetical protein
MQRSPTKFGRLISTGIEIPFYFVFKKIDRLRNPKVDPIVWIAPKGEKVLTSNIVSGGWDYQGKSEAMA